MYKKVKAEKGFGFKPFLYRESSSNTGRKIELPSSGSLSKMMVFYIIGQRGRDLPSKYSPSVTATVFQERKDRSCFGGGEIGGYSSVRCGVSSSRTNKKLVGRNSHQKKLCLTSIFFADDDSLVLSFISRPWKESKGGVGLFTRESNLPPLPAPKQGLFQVAWDQNELISKPAERDL